MSTTTAEAPAKNNGQLVKRELNIVDSTLERIHEMEAAGQLKIPKDYSAVNALKSAWLILQDVKDMNKKPVLDVCTKESIAYALLKMVLEGLNPMKRQCSFIAYGNKLTMQREYQGSIAIAKRVGLKSIIANAVFDGDEFKYEFDSTTGRKKINSHTQTMDSLGNAVKGAYAIVTMEDGSTNVEVMNIKQIQQAWQQGPTKGQSPAHKNFPDQMACKTVINRAVKTIINSSDDADLFEDDEQNETPFTAAVKHEISENSNKGEIGFDNEHENVDTETGEVKEEISSEATETGKEKIQQGEQIKAPFA
jgi:recombination protein RecT